MTEILGDTFIYIQSEYSLESDCNKSQHNDRIGQPEYSFDKSTPDLLYSGSPNSYKNKRYFEPSHFTQSSFDCTPKEGNNSTLNRGNNSRGYLKNQHNRSSRNPSGISPKPRSNTCNVTIPCELEEKLPEFQNYSLRQNLGHSKYKLPKSHTTNHHSKPFNDTHRHKRHFKRKPKSIRDLDLESQYTMKESVDDKDTDDFLLNAGRELLLAPEFAADQRTRRFLSLAREVFVAVIGCQLVYILSSLLFGNVALTIIVTLLLIQSCFCHCDGRPLSYLVNAVLSLSIGVTVIVALAQEVSGLEPFRTEPVLKTLSYVYIPICFFFTLLSVVLAVGFRRLHNRERKAVVTAANNLLGNEYYVDQKTLEINRQTM